MRVLLVEDDAMIAQAVSANLKDTGYAVDWVSRGSEVAAAVAAQAYDLLLLDLGYPAKTVWTYWHKSATEAVPSPS